MTSLKEHLLTPIHKQKATMFDFAGFLMPLFYESILKEHLAVRKKVGIFDVSHMGRAIIEGLEATKFINYLTANDVNRLVNGKAHYSLFLNENGGIIDDILVYRFSSQKYLIVYNASNRGSDISWLKKHSPNYDVKINDISDQTIMLAIQGPLARNIIKNIQVDALNLKRFYFINFLSKGLKGIISRTGYTGEDGFEIIFFYDNEQEAIDFWKYLENKIIELGGALCGLGARDSLRLEAGYCLYGNDISLETNPYEANLGWVVKLDQNNFIGKEKLIIVKEKIKRLRIGFIMSSRAIPRHNYKIYSENFKEIGVVTSGGFSPILNKGMGMGYILKEHAKTENNIFIAIRGKKIMANIKSFPLYDTNIYGYNRTK